MIELPWVVFAMILAGGLSAILAIETRPFFAATMTRQCNEWPLALRNAAVTRHDHQPG
jgi:hypothetical protein